MFFNYQVFLIFSSLAIFIFVSSSSTVCEFLYFHSLKIQTFLFKLIFSVWYLKLQIVGFCTRFSSKREPKVIWMCCSLCWIFLLINYRDNVEISLGTVNSITGIIYMPEPAKVCGSIKYMHPAPQRNKFINIPYSNIFHTLLNVPITVNVYCTISNVFIEKKQ